MMMKMKMLDADARDTAEDCTVDGAHAWLARTSGKGDAKREDKEYRSRAR